MNGVHRVWSTFILSRRDWIPRYLVAALFLATLFLSLYHLDTNPRTWRDEGGSLLVARSVAINGVYAEENAGDWHCFGAVQSVGPTVIVPIATVFRLFGVGILQGRLVVACYLLLCVGAFHAVARALFGWHVSTLATLLLLTTPSISLIANGHQVLAEVPALTFLLAGVWAFHQALRKQQTSLWAFAGILIGLSMVTKMHFIVIGFATIFVVGVLDALWYRQGSPRNWLIFVSMAVVCLASWWSWQRFYFGPVVFAENLSAMKLLSSNTSGFDRMLVWAAIRQLFLDREHFFYYWGVPALIYGAYIVKRRDHDGLTAVFLLSFALIGLSHWILWIVPWWHYALASLSIAALFVAKLWDDLYRKLAAEHGAGLLQRASATVLFFLFAIGFAFTLKQLRAQDTEPQAAAIYAASNIPSDAIVELWDRELAFLGCGGKCHTPDQVLLAQTRVPYQLSDDPGLGESYFRRHRIDFLIVGWLARQGHVYDPEYIARHATLLTTVGTGERRYEVYKFLDQ
jgi:4-amino-4-deoxy-L-arabinose transferase-like glycosyltransferase